MSVDASGGEWVELGSFPVDSASCWIGDAALYTQELVERRKQCAQGDWRMILDGQRSQEIAGGVEMWTGVGDGTYTVMGRVLDVGDGTGGSDVRLAEIKVVFIDDETLREWHDEER